MRRISILFGLLLMVACLCGCAGKSVEPFVNTTRYDHGNDVAVGTFVYSAVNTNTRDVRENEIEHTALGKGTMLGFGIADHVCKLTALELSNTGLKLNDQADIIIYGDVTLFKVDDWGFSLDLMYKITYTIFRKSTKETLFSQQYSPPIASMNKSSLEFGTITLGSSPSFNRFCLNMILQGYSMFITDPDVKSILDKVPTSG